MNIVIVGCGKVGTTLIASVVSEGHDVTAVDADPDALESIKYIYDVMTVCGNGSGPDALAEAGADKADLLISVTNSDEVNMLACFFAKKMGCKHTIARIRDTDYNERSLGFIKNQLSLSMTINPEQLAAKELFNILKLPSALKIETFSSRRFEMIELKLKKGSDLAGLKLSELRTKYKEKFLICAVQRGHNVFIPNGDFILEEGDKIGLTAEPAEITKLLKNHHILQKQARNVIIFGGSRTAFYLAKRLLSAGNSVKIIEHDQERCNELCELLPGADICCGDGTQQELLEEEGIASTDAFVALTGIDEENILISFFAASKNVPKVISKVNREELAAIAESMGLDSIVSPKKMVADVLLRYIRALQNSVGSKVETLYKLMDSNVEALEFIVNNDFKGNDVPLKDLKLKKNILVAGIVRDRTIIIPSGADYILPGDRVVVISAADRLKDLGDILAK